MQGHPYFRVDTQDGYEDLYRRLTNQPRAVPGEIGELKKLRQLRPLADRAQLGPSAGTLPPQSEDTGRKKFFISYPHGDPDEENLARFLHSHLTQAGHEAFIDMSIKAGMDWVKEINYRIHWCDYLVVLLSENAMGSEMVQTEVRIARRFQRRTGNPQIIPVRLRYFGPLEYELEIYLGHLQYIEWKGPEGSGRVLEKILNATQIEIPFGDTEQPGPSDRLRAVQVPKPVKDPCRPQATIDPRSASMPGGTMRHDDPCYITRPEDNVVESLALGTGQTLVIKGPRQIGKSSLLLHYLSQCQQAGKKAAFIDFSIFSGDDFSSYPTFLSRLALVLQHRLRIEGAGEPTIDGQFGMIQFIKMILAYVDGPLVIAFDEVDRVFGREYQADFFTMLRYWHNSRTPLSPEWENLDLSLVISTEPYLLINESDRSPFNVGCILDLKPFNQDQCYELNKKYDNILSKPQVDDLWDLLRGHPFLTRLGFYRLTAPDRITFSELMEKAAKDRGPFGNHLRALLVKLHENPDLLDAMKQVIRYGTAPSKDLYYRLYGAGLVRREGERINPANLLYARYFKKVI